MIEQRNIVLDPALLKVRDALIKQYRGIVCGREKRALDGFVAVRNLRQILSQQHYGGGEQVVENVTRALTDYVYQRGISRPFDVKWGSWGSPYGDDTDIDIVVKFELSAHFPKGAWPRHYPVPTISKEMGGFRDDLQYLEEKAIDWGKGIIDRFAKAIYLVPATMPDELVSWLSKNCDGRFYLTELDPNESPHIGFPSDTRCYPSLGIRCLSFESEDDAVLFKLRWS